MILKVRTHPTNIYYVTGHDAEAAHEAACDDDEKGTPCFVTASFESDGFAWESPEDFERDWAVGPGCDDASFADFRG